MRLTAPALLALLLAAAHAAALAPAEFERTAELEGPFKAGVYYKVDLPAEALRAGRPRLPDLRLFAPDGAECRYVVVEHSIPGQGARHYPLELSSFAEASDAVSLVAAIKSENPDPIERIDLSIPERNFRKEVTVEAETGGAWSVVATAAIYDFSDQVDLRRTSIDLPDVRAARFRLTLRDTADGRGAGNAADISLKFDGLDFTATRHGGASRLRIDGVTARSGLLRAGEVRRDEAAFPVPALVSERPGERSFALEIGLPVETIHFDIEPGEFVRAVRLEAADSARGPFTPIARGTLSSVNLTGRREIVDSLNVGSPRVGFARVVFEDRGNPPLPLRRIVVRYVRRVLVFVPERDLGRLTLCVGHPDLAPPQYDLASIVTQANWHEARQYLDVPCPPLAVNAKVERPLPGADRERAERALLLAVVALLAAGLGFWLYKVIQAVPPPGGGGPAAG